VIISYVAQILQRERGIISILVITCFHLNFSDDELLSYRIGQHISVLEPYTKSFKHPMYIWSWAGDVAWGRAPAYQVGGPSRAPVAHTCNPSYSGGRDQENWGWRSAWANSLWDPISKYPTQRRVGRVAQVIEHLPCKCKALSSNPPVQ
jgi:hypothetical protein